MCFHWLYRKRERSSEICKETQEPDDNPDDPEVKLEDTQPVQPPPYADGYLSADLPDNCCVAPDRTVAVQQQSVVPPQKIASKRKKSRIEASVSELVTIMKSSSYAHSQYPNTSCRYCCEHDGDEMFFLSMAKSLKKLNLAERIRIKSEVSQIVFQAEYRNLQNGALSPAISERSTFHSELGGGPNDEES